MNLLIKMNAVTLIGLYLIGLYVCHDVTWPVTASFNVRAMFAIPLVIVLIFSLGALIYED